MTHNYQIIVYNPDFDTQKPSFWDTRIITHSIYGSPNLSHFFNRTEMQSYDDARSNIKSFSDFNKPYFRFNDFINFSNQNSKYFFLDVIKRWFYVMGTHSKNFIRNSCGFFSTGIKNVLLWYGIHPNHSLDLLSMIICIFSVLFFIQKFFFFFFIQNFFNFVVY